MTIPTRSFSPSHRWDPRLRDGTHWVGQAADHEGPIWGGLLDPVVIQEAPIVLSERCELTCL